MGITFSCPGADYDSLEDDFEAVIVRSISFKGDDVKTTFRSVSFNGRDSEPTILKSIGSGKMFIEGSVSFKRNDSFHLETTISIKTPPLGKMENAVRTVSFKDTEIGDSLLRSNSLTERIPGLPVLESGSPKHEAAVKLQKVYKSFRTRRKLADCAVLVEQRWWKLLDFAVLKQSSVSFFDIGKPETAVSRWMRARTRAAKVGKGLSKDEKARKLALQHWLEAIDPRHRYGHNLHFYYDSWLHCVSRQPFFYWLDVGEGKEVNLERCPRSKLQQQCIKYLGPKEREDYEVIVENGKFLYKRTRMLFDTSEGPKDSKWIFVLSTSKTLYVGQKMKGKFQHSSFLAGGATSAAGRLVVENGILKAVWPHSGHYRPTEENFQEFVTFLNENNVDLTDVKKSPTDEEEEMGSKCYVGIRSNFELNLSRRIADMATEKATVEREPESNQSHALENKMNDITIPKGSDCFLRSESAGRCMGLSCSSFSTESQSVQDENAEESSTSEKEYMFRKRNLFEEDQEEDEEEIVPKESILRRINSKKDMKSYQLGKQLSFKWTTGVGPRIACMRDYPSELQFRALEQVNLSPRSKGNCRAYPSPRNIASPKSLTPSLLREDSIKNSNHCN